MSAEVVDIRKYALVDINGDVQLAVYTQGRWTLDATCESINEMLRIGIVGEEAVRAWVHKRFLRRA